MKKGVIKFFVLLAIFVLSVAGFSFFLNREKTENTRDFETPTLPVAFIRIGDISLIYVNLSADIFPSDLL